MIPQIPQLKKEQEILERDPEGARIAVSNALYQLDEKIEETARQHFAAHPDEEEAPFEVFLTTNHLTRHLDLVPKVGTENINFHRRFAVATVITGRVQNG